MQEGRALQSYGIGVIGPNSSSLAGCLCPPALSLTATFRGDLRAAAGHLPSSFLRVPSHSNVILHHVRGPRLQEALPRALPRVNISVAHANTW